MIQIDSISIDGISMTGCLMSGIYNNDKNMICIIKSILISLSRRRTTRKNGKNSFYPFDISQMRIGVHRTKLQNLFLPWDGSWIAIL